METREQMILKHMPLVTFVVGRMSTDRQSIMGLEREDAIAYGVEGLIQAVDSFDPNRGTTFAGFAIRRIRGSILDAIRRADPLPRSLRRSTKELESASHELAAQLGRWPTPKEIAIKTGLPLEQVRETLRHSSSRVVSLESVLQDRDNDGGRTIEILDDSEDGDPAQVAENQAALDILAQAVSSLNARDRAIIFLRYGESQAFHEIGQTLGLSESRVCQLHKRIVAALRREVRRTMQDVA